MPVDTMPPVTTPRSRRLMELRGVEAGEVVVGAVAVPGSGDIPWDVSVLVGFERSVENGWDRCRGCWCCLSCSVERPCILG